MTRMVEESSRGRIVDDVAPAAGGRPSAKSKAKPKAKPKPKSKPTKKKVPGPAKKKQHDKVVAKDVKNIVKKAKPVKPDDSTCL